MQNARTELPQLELHADTRSNAPAPMGFVTHARKIVHPEYPALALECRSLACNNSI